MPVLKVKQNGQWVTVAGGGSGGGSGGGFVAQSDAPDDTSLLWIDTDDDTIDAGSETGAAEIPENVVTCDLEGATEDESAVPVNADTLGGFAASEYLRHSAISAILQNSLGTLSGLTDLPLTQAYCVGTDFEMTDDGKIRCLKDGFVMASASIMVASGAQSVYIGLLILNNNTSNGLSYYTYIGGNYGCIGLPSSLIPVNVGDIISLGVNAKGVTLNASSRTFLSLMYV